VDPGGEGGLENVVRTSAAFCETHGGESRSCGRLPDLRAGPATGSLVGPLVGPTIREDTHLARGRTRNPAGGSRGGRPSLGYARSPPYSASGVSVSRRRRGVLAERRSDQPSRGDAAVLRSDGPISRLEVPTRSCGARSDQLGLCGLVRLGGLTHIHLLALAGAPSRCHVAWLAGASWD
jgi:hypothetical protein